MVHRIGLAGADYRDVIHHFSDIRKPVGNPQPALPMLFEGTPRGEQPVTRFSALRGDQILRMERGRYRLECQLFEQRLGIEQIDLTGAAFHETPDDVFCQRRMMRLLGRKRVHGSSVPILRQHAGERDSRQTTAGACEKFAARGDIPMMSISHWFTPQLMYKNSLEANSMCAR